MAQSENSLPTNNSESAPASVPNDQAAEKNTIKIVIVNIPRGADVIASIIDVAHRGNFSFTVLSAQGTITSATLSHIPGGPPVFMLEEPSTMISLFGSYFYKIQFTLDSGATPPSNLPFAVHLSYSHGDVVGSTVIGGVFAGNGVQVVLCTFRNTHVHLLRG